MAPYNGRLRALFLSSLILIVGIIHLGVGIGIVVRYRQYSVLQQTVSLSGYNIFIGIYTILVGIFAVITSLSQNQILRVIATVAVFLMGIFTFASLIAALALSGQTVSYLRDTISDNMHSYAQDSDAKDTMDRIQTDFTCCGVNLWLDWASVQLDAFTQPGFGRRRRDYHVSSGSTLVRALRLKRQIYNLDPNYSIKLPVSCCSAGGTFIGNSLGGYCMIFASNSTSTFYLSGCLAPVANIGLSQIVGIAVINTCLTILAFVCFIKLIMIIRQHPDQNDVQQMENGKNQEQLQQYQPPPPQQIYQQPQYGQQYHLEPPMQHQYEQQYHLRPPLQHQYQQPQYEQDPQHQQYSYGQYHMNNANPNAAFGYKSPTIRTYL